MGNLAGVYSMTEKLQNKTYIIFPTKKVDGSIAYYASSYQEPIDVESRIYKGYRCQLKDNESKLETAQALAQSDIILDKNKPVAIKFYEDETKMAVYPQYAPVIGTAAVEGEVCKIMELVDGFHLLHGADDLKSLTFYQAVDIAWQCLQLLNSLHYQNTKGVSIVHGDLNGRNIKIRKIKGSEENAQYEVVLIDFDNAVVISDKPKPAFGTKEHTAPALRAMEG